MNAWRLGDVACHPAVRTRLQKSLPAGIPDVPVRGRQLPRALGGLSWQTPFISEEPLWFIILSDDSQHHSDNHVRCSIPIWSAAHGNPNSRRRTRLRLSKVSPLESQNPSTMLPSSSQASSVEPEGRNPHKSDGNQSLSSPIGQLSLVGGRV
jgi:hypothetical protein